MSATPIATCISVIGLIWLTTVANFGGPSLTGKIGQITVWGVIIPVAGLSVIGWFWFSGQTFGEAWNPQGLSLGEGMGSSIALTLWAFLGMESAAQNSDAVENPKRDVPLACMFGTLGAAVVYVLSTTVIQGIVPNAELAKSTGPFALAYAKMFNPTIGSIIMGLAVLACLGSLLGWQFTIAQTAKAPRTSGCSPRSSRRRTAGAPVAGMIVMGIVQTAMALSTISPSLSEQFSVLVNLAVVTNVVPYIISLSALVVIMKTAGVTGSMYRATPSSPLCDALQHLCDLCLRHRGRPRRHDRPGGDFHPLRLPRAAIHVRETCCGSVFPGRQRCCACHPNSPVADVHGAARFRGKRTGACQASGKLTFGYGADARPFSYKDESGNPAGYAIALCGKIADAAKAGLGLPALAVEYVPVARDEGLRAVVQGKIDVLCEATVPTLTSRKEVSFSIPIFASGIGAVERRDASTRLKDILSDRRPPTTPTWRANADQLIDRPRFR